MRRLAAPSLVALVLACALIAGVAPHPAARADATAMAVIACENLAPYLDGDPGDTTTPADVDAACAQPIPPDGDLSISSLEFGLGGTNAHLEYEEVVPLDELDGNRIDVSCTYDAVVTQATKPAAGCVLLVLVFVDDTAVVTADITPSLTLVESGGSLDHACDTVGVLIGQDDDCDDPLPPPPGQDGVVVFHLLTSNAAVNGSDTTVAAMQEAVEQSAEISFTGETRVLDDSDLDGVSFAVDNCPIHPNPDQTNTDARPIVTGGFPDDRTIPDSDILGNACDRDDDNDGIRDTTEPAIGAGGVSPPPSYPCLGATGPTSPLLADTDGDRVLDGAECALGSDPVDPESKPVLAPGTDPDGDGLPTQYEDARRFNPFSPDTDGDRIPDGVEFKGYNTSPQHHDTDGDGCSDAREISSLDGNTTVNILDLMIVSYSIGLNPQQLRADVDKNGIANIIDIMIVVASFAGVPC